MLRKDEAVPAASTDLSTSRTRKWQSSMLPSLQRTSPVGWWCREIIHKFYQIYVNISTKCVSQKQPFLNHCWNTNSLRISLRIREHSASMKTHEIIIIWRLQANFETGRDSVSPRSWTTRETLDHRSSALLRLQFSPVGLFSDQAIINQC